MHYSVWLTSTPVVSATELTLLAPTNCNELLPVCGEFPQPCNSLTFHFDLAPKPTDIGRVWRPIVATEIILTLSSEPAKHGGANTFSSAALAFLKALPPQCLLIFFFGGPHPQPSHKLCHHQCSGALVRISWVRAQKRGRL
jgi:hypothetical protein